MQAHATWAPQLSAERVPDQRVSETQPVGRPRDLGHDTSLGLLERVKELLFGSLAHVGERVELELPAEH